MDTRPTTEQGELWGPEEVWHPARFKRHSIPEKLASLRQKLYRKAKQEPEFRFYVLHDRIYRPDVLACAYRIARAAKKAAGVDGVTFEAVESRPGGVEGFVKELHESLKTKTYKPEAVRRTYIRKVDGRQRPLGIPTVRDRVVQMATLLILEPIFEADFLDCSYGFRPERSAHDALAEIRENIKAGRMSVYDADLAGYFDTIPHDKLLKCVRKRVVDRSVLKLIRMWLSAPVVEKDDDGRKKVTRPKQGTPQGGVLSPLLANLYLHWFDHLFHASTGPARWAGARLIRYADDFVVMARYQGDRLVRFIENTLEGRFDLRLNRQKTKVVNLRRPGESLDFLGYTFRYDRDLHGRPHRYLNIVPSRKALQAERDAIRGLVNKSRSHVALPDLLVTVNRQVRGWANYFCFGYPRMACRGINWYVRQRLARHLHRRSQRPYRPPEGRSLYRHLEAMGLVRL